MTRNLSPAASLGLLCSLFVPTPAPAINIVIDYSYDTNNFFSSQASRDAMRAAADRYSTIITSTLAPVLPGGTATGTSAGWRIGFTHPGSGSSYQLSSSANFDDDPLGPNGGANEYGFAGLPADTFILFAGGRSMSVAGQGGTGTGLNYNSTFNDINGPMHRGFDDNTPSATSNDLPRWGGAISFNTNLSWHFDLATTASGGRTDFYSLALHELGHALGLGADWNQWPDNGSGRYLGVNGINAYNDDNGTSVSRLDLVSNSDNHWEDGSYKSFPHPGGNTVGTVPDGTLQDLLMEPTANFTASQRRFELTNVDVGALQDVGWEVAPEPSTAMLAVLGISALALRRRR